MLSHLWHAHEALDIDYLTANDPTLGTLNESQRAELYSELASGAETGLIFLSWLSRLAD